MSLHWIFEDFSFASFFNANILSSVLSDGLGPLFNAADTSIFTTLTHS